MTSRSNKLRGQSRNFLLKVEEETLEALRSIAKSRSISVSQVMRDALRSYLTKKSIRPVHGSPRAWWN